MHGRPEPALPPVPARPALFLDVDGTLVDLVARPEDVSADEALRRELERLAERLGGAVALLSGRSLADLARIFGPLRLAAAGVHGAELRLPDGVLLAPVIDPGERDAAHAWVERLVRRDPRLRLEDKGAAIAVHCRDAPELEHWLERQLVEFVRTRADVWQVQAGLLVRELKPAGASKGSALRRLMQDAPFAGRTPIAIGDDLTDLEAFAAATELGGFGVAIGARVSAQWTLARPADLRCWLAGLLRPPRD